MKAIIDTNVFISGVFWAGIPAKVLKAWQDHQFDLVMSPAILDEYKRVLEKLSKKYRQIDIIPILDFIIRHGILYSPIKLPKQISRDPDDDKFIALALASNTSYIITGDDDLLSVDGYLNIRMLTPREFYEICLE